MNSKFIFCLLALCQLTSCAELLDKDLTEAIDNLFSIAEINESTDSIKTLSEKSKTAAEDDDTIQLSITQGANSRAGHTRNQNAMTILNAYQKIMTSKDLSYKQRKNVVSYYTIPGHYCPKHNYNYYKCNENLMYRRYDGSCNNLYVPWWGKSNTPCERLVKASYDDGISKARSRSVTGSELPNPRDIAMFIHKAHKTKAQTTQFFTFYGQFLFHDFVLTGRSSYKDGTEKHCGCGSDYKDPDCLPIPIPARDYYNKDQKCFPFTRSSPVGSMYNDCKFKYREQENLVTAWVDLSNIYGSHDRLATKLRSYKFGLMKISISPENGHSDFPLMSASECPHKDWKIQSCFMTGEHRAEDNHYISSFGRIYLREHNRLARALYKINPYWSDEKTYQEARRINIAQLQHTTYYEFLPILLGSRSMKHWKLLPSRGYFDGYDKNLSPQLRNAFIIAARYGHALVNRDHYTFDDQYNLISNVTTNKVLFTHAKDTDIVMRGSLLQHSYYFSPAINDYMNNHLFEGMSKKFERLSLGAINIQRGRDHGLPGYNKYRKWCGLKYARSFDELVEIPYYTREKLKKIYMSVDDIDLFTGCMSEYPVKDGVVGPTTSCILGAGFHDWKYADRFWYETNDKLTGFTKIQLNEIRKSSIASLICDNTHIYFTATEPLLRADRKYNKIVDCSKIKRIDLRAWKDINKNVY